MKAADIMTKEPIVVVAPGSRDSVLKIIASGKASGVPVVRGDELIGIITHRDLVRKPNETQLALLMTKDPITVKPKTRLAQVAEAMVTHNIHRLPVVDKRKIVGIITTHDVLKVLIDMRMEKDIREYIKPCVPIYQNTPLNVAFNILKITAQYALPVLNEDAKLIGIITDSDVFKQSKVQINHVISDLGLGEDEDAWTWEGMRNIMKFYYEVEAMSLPRIPIKDIMVHKVIAATRTSMLGDVAALMHRHDVDQIPVKNYDDEVIGMVYDLDLLKVLVQ